MRISPVNDIRQVFQRDLAFQKYIFRRAWGVYYAIWAAVIAFYLIVPDPAKLMSLNGGLATALNMVISLLITLMAVVATARLFLGARKATVLRRTMWTNKGGRKHWPFFVIWLAAISSPDSRRGGILTILCWCDSLCELDSRSVSHLFPD